MRRDPYIPDDFPSISFGLVQSAGVHLHVSKSFFRVDWLS